MHALAYLGLFSLITLMPYANAATTCPAVNKSGLDVKISELHPTQAYVGMGEVLKKKKDLSNVNPNVPSSDDSDPVPVVSGPGGQLYVSDHHHFILALLLAKGANALVHTQVINNDFCKSCPAESPQCTQNFWKFMAKDHLAYFCNEHDQSIGFNQLPSSFSENAKPRALQNDPYRTLVNVLREIAPSNSHQPCLVRPNDNSVFFWEFRMAEKIRRKVSRAFDQAMQSREFSQTTKFSQSIIDNACAAFAADAETSSCSAKVSANPDLVLH